MREFSSGLRLQQQNLRKLSDCTIETDSERPVTKISAKVRTGSKYYEGTVENISGEGLIEIAFVNIKVKDFDPETIVSVQFHKHCGDDLELQCKLVWFRLNKDNPDRLKYCLGMEILSPNTSYKNFLKTF